VSDRSQRYPVSVFWSDEDEGFIAIAPDLPGSSAFGETQPEALAELEHAIEAWIDAALAAGNPIPEPTRPVAETEPSGRLLVRMPKQLHGSLARAAKNEGISLNQYVIFLLTQGQTYKTAQDLVQASVGSQTAAIAHQAAVLAHQSAVLAGHQTDVVGRVRGVFGGGITIRGTAVTSQLPPINLPPAMTTISSIGGPVRVTPRGWLAELEDD
jgi:predicted RNase H-like HicB family nuclease